MLPCESGLLSNDSTSLSFFLALANQQAEAGPFRKEPMQILTSLTLDADDMVRQGELLTYLAAHDIKLH